ncbi:NADP-dependent oxidoreductase [Streptomyces sp. NBC_01506]|uniref:NADP-dependent oxidoreductase n=1 Tax=Streptomyces sp. NBC_01506 TaxID=2903887 RepID=UPI00386601AD
MSMRAYQLEGFDSAPRIVDVPRPTPGTGEVLVQVRTSSVNPLDANIAAGRARRYKEYVFPAILGSDFCGVVAETGPGVTELSVGDRVFGLVHGNTVHTGSFAEFLAVPQDQLTVVPAAVDDLTAGALGLAGVTAAACLDAVRVGDGDTLLVVGGSGGVGSFATRFAAAQGVRVIATARPGHEENHVLRLGAAETVDWSAQDVALTVRGKHPDGVTAVIDLIDRDPAAFTPLVVGTLAPGGRAASTLRAADSQALGGIPAVNVRPKVDPKVLRRLAELAEHSLRDSPVTAVYDFDRIGEAFAALAAGSVGKLALRIST